MADPNEETSIISSENHIDPADNPYAVPSATLEAPRANKGPVGLGGWLILVCIGLFANAGIMMFNIFNSGRALFQSGIPRKFIPLLGFEVLANLILLVFCLVVLAFFFLKKKQLPKTYIALLFGLFLMQAIDQIWAAAIGIIEAEDVAVSFTRPLIALGIWGAYMLKSKRVRNTFVK